MYSGNSYAPNTPGANATKFDVQLGKSFGEGAQAAIHDCEVQPANTQSQLPPARPGTSGYCAKVFRTEEEVALLVSADSKVVESRTPTATAEAIVLAGAVARAVQQDLDHPNIVPYLQVDQRRDARSLSILMPKYAGDLQRWTGERAARMIRSKEATVLHIAEQLASALRFLHDRGVWHLDVNGMNVLVSSVLDDLPLVVLTDLEASTVGGQHPPEAFTEHMAAPERAKAPSAKCDVWSLGMLLFAMAAAHEYPGIVPDVPELGSVSMNQEQLTPARIAAVVQRDMRGMSDGLTSLVIMMLNHDPETRPSMTDVVNHLSALRRSGGAKLTFPFSLGPLDLGMLSYRSAPEAPRVEVYDQSDMYDVHKARCWRCGKIRSHDKHNRSVCSGGDGEDLHLPTHSSPPWNAVELPGTRIMDIGGGPLPPTAEWRFLYPFDSDPTAAEAAEAGEGGYTQLQLHGGLAIRPHPHNPWIPLALRSSKGSENRLWFTAAQPWPSAVTEQLHVDGRIHDRVPSLLGESAPRAQRFCWICPGETFILPNNEQWVPAPHGGLVFWFNDDPSKPHAMDRYFAVTAPLTSLSESAGRATSAAVSDVGRLTGKVVSGIVSSASQALRSGAVGLVASASTAARGGPRLPGTGMRVRLRELRAAVEIHRRPDEYGAMRSHYTIGNTQEQGGCTGAVRQTGPVFAALRAPGRTMSMAVLESSSVGGSPNAPRLLEQGGLVFFDAHDSVVRCYALRVDDGRGADDLFGDSFDMPLRPLQLLPAGLNASFPCQPLRAAGGSGGGGQRGGGPPSPHLPSRDPSSSGSEWEEVLPGGTAQVGLSAAPLGVVFGDAEGRSWGFRAV